MLATLIVRKNLPQILKQASPLIDVMGQIKIAEIIFRKPSYFEGLALKK
jgi:hypothetical protein